MKHYKMILKFFLIVKEVLKDNYNKKILLSDKIILDYKETYLTVELNNNHWLERIKELKFWLLHWTNVMMIRKH